MTSIVIYVTADDANGGYVGCIEGLPGCLRTGATPSAAIRAVADAYDDMRDTLLALDVSLAGGGGE